MSPVHWKSVSRPKLDLDSREIQASPLRFGCPTLFFTSDRRNAHAYFRQLTRRAYVISMSCRCIAWAERSPIWVVSLAYQSEGMIATNFKIRATLAAQGQAYARRSIRRTLESKLRSAIKLVLSGGTELPALREGRTLYCP